jgi:hypothetical protein
MTASRGAENARSAGKAAGPESGTGATFYKFGPAIIDRRYSNALGAQSLAPPGQIGRARQKSRCSDIWMKRGLPMVCCVSPKPFSDWFAAGER